MFLSKYLLLSSLYLAIYIPIQGRWVKTIYNIQLNITRTKNPTAKEASIQLTKDVYNILYIATYIIFVSANNYFYHFFLISYNKQMLEFDLKCGTSFSCGKYKKMSWRHRKTASNRFVTINTYHLFMLLFEIWFYAISVAGNFNCISGIK